MGVSWTREQQQVIDLRGRNILVSAAAGSGKTAVLVERILRRIMDEKEPVDIDRLLVVTFTNAAAAEMRERIGAAIEQALSEQPGNEHLERQLTLIHNAQITTIDSFCLYVIRNHFHEIDLEPNFRIGDEGELTLLMEDILAQVMERNYAEPTEQFLALMDGYATGRDDKRVGEMVREIYEFSRSYPWPGEWLSGCVQGYQVKDVQEMLHAEWMQPLLDDIRCVLHDMAELMRRAAHIAGEADGPKMYVPLLLQEQEAYESLAACMDFAEFCEAFGELSYGRLPSSRGFDGDTGKLDQVKKMREQAKDAAKKLAKQYFFAAPELLAKQLRQTAPFVEELVRLTEEFADAFAAEKRQKNLVDFHDLEHFALEILVDGETKCARRTAEEFRDTFEEIMIDEYQDSNYVQEAILRAISTEERGKNNIFMVGDVKQSIYRFRLARPELFMEKYDTYTLEDSDTQRIDLHRNFRSRDEVLSCTNKVFFLIMARDLGNVEYSDEAALHPGAVYPKAIQPAMFAPELLLVDSREADEEDDPKLLEAKLVAERIRQLMDTQLVTDKETGALRKIRYADIVILLRSLSSHADAFAEVLNDSGIPAHAVSATGYFSAVEVQTVLSCLTILDNPRQDIPLAAVLRSPIVGMTDEELARVRLLSPAASFHECVLDECERLCKEWDANGEGAREDALSEAYQQKLLAFYRVYLALRERVPDTPIHEIILLLLRETGYGSYAAAMPAGSRRQANLQMLVERAIAYENTSYRGLFHFVRYIDELRKYNVDFGEADLSGENEDVVRIMSIHKSKGLEFPVVFVSGLGKQFNRQDVRGTMVLHPELGVGLDYRDVKRRLKAPTIAKKAIARRVDLENLGEELRVLYVAMTRAKEKLILTGNRKDAREELDTLAASVVSGEEGPLSYLARESAQGYLDWLLAALYACGEKDMVRVVSTEELVWEEAATQVKKIQYEADFRERIDHADSALVSRIEERFSYRYPFSAGLEQKNKYSVSELKHRAMRERLEQEEEELVPAFLQEEIVPYIPAFARRQNEEEEEPVNRGALRGTAVHRVMECYQFSSALDVGEQIEQMLAEGRITADMVELVRQPLIEQFVDSEVGARMRTAETAGRLYREKPFVMGFTREELERFGFGEMREETVEGHGTDGGTLTLIQGIIDVFWVEDDGIVVLDYKTDRVDTARQLVDRYAAQLRLYGEALERLYNRGEERSVRVKERLLYSFRLGEVIPV